MDRERRIFHFPETPPASPPRRRGAPIGTVELSAMLLELSGESVSLQKQGLDTAGTQVLAEVVAVHQTLRSLDLTENLLDDDACASLAEALMQQAGKPAGLEALLLDRNVIGADGAESLACALPVSWLTTLGLSGNDIGVGAVAIASALPNSRLRQLDLSASSLGDAEATALGNALRHSRLEVLDLSGNEISALGVEALCAPGAAPLRTLRLACNYLGPEAGESLAAAVCSLRVLDVEDTGLGPEGIRALSRGIRRSSTIEVLDLTAAGAEPYGATELACALEANKSLTALRMAMNQVEDSGAIAIASALRKNSVMRKLDLESNLLTAEGALALADALPHSALTELELAYNSIEIRGVAAIMKSLRANRTLTSLGLQGVFPVSSENEREVRRAVRVEKAFADLLTRNFTLVHLDLDPIEQGADLAERLARNAELPEAWLALRRMERTSNAPLADVLAAMSSPGMARSVFRFLVPPEFAP
jgi:Ran GTPase-activating protein (RanGAP) involved in mRNA processing and transport